MAKVKSGKGSSKARSRKGTQKAKPRKRSQDLDLELEKLSTGNYRFTDLSKGVVDYDPEKVSIDEEAQTITKHTC